MAESTQQQTKRYKKTLNLPKTAFSMKANLVQHEPASQKRWDEMGLYQRLRERGAGKPRFVFHDGPPYANGSIHLGHLENKVLKDFVVRSRTMAGYDTPYVPGWDCHGLPIEHKVMQELGEKARGMAPMQIRKRCRDYAEKYVKVQAKQMQRLLTVADYDHPYLTMNAGYEAAVLEVFADLVERGLVYRGLKPVHWSIENQTALADAELEYEQRTDTSVYVLFEVADASALPAACGLAQRDEPVYLMIWTTTPWTLPANLAVAVAPRAEYTLYRLPESAGGKLVLLASDLAKTVFAKQSLSLDDVQSLGQCTGGDLVGLQYKHVFIERTGPVVSADYVSIDASGGGTGLVHTAPGHGTEDYQTGLREGLDIYCPVRDDGTFDDTVPEWLRGKSVWEANDAVVEHLHSSGHLFHDEPFEHSYPHDWRSKTPVIFRATYQWFVSVDKPADGKKALRERAMQAIDNVQFFPKWGYNRMRGMLESRPDWCLSRQRSWGLPIPAFYNEAGEVLLTPASVRAVVEVVREQGSDAWFQMEADDLLAHYEPTKDVDAPDWVGDARSRERLRKGSDIFDVWFESGSSWHAAIEQRFGEDAFPTDLYLEGSDQHRGWFQLSLLPAVAVRGQSPFKAVLTHGFTVDRHGRKMSKSEGNALEVEDLLKNFGADVCRWWVSTISYEGDVKVDEEFFREAGDQYRKVRNTIRFMLSNLSDYDATYRNRHFTDADALTIDAWAVARLNQLTEQVTAAYDNYDFRRVSELLFNFCNDTMSAVYLAAVKDRLYCDKPDATRRRRTQTALHVIADAVIRLLAPIMPHTTDEAWRALHGEDAESVHLQALPESARVAMDPRWATIMQRREQWLKRIEDFRQAHEIDNPLDLGVSDADEQGALTAFDTADLGDLCGVSRFTIEPGPAVHDLRDEPRCERSWKRDGTVKQRSDGGYLSDRDADAVGV